MSLGFHITVFMYILFEVQIIGDLYMFIQTPASVGLIFRAWKCMIDCCSGDNGGGGGTAATRQQWRCQQQKRSALKEGAEAASRADCCSGGNGGGGGAVATVAVSSTEGRVLKEGAEAVVASMESVAGWQQWRRQQQQKNKNGGNRCYFTGYIPYSIIPGVMWYIRVYTGKGDAVYSNTRQCTVSVHIANYIRFNI